MRKFFTINKSFEGVSTKELWERAQKEGCDALNMVVGVTLTKREGDGDGKFHAVFSTDHEDRHYDIVRQEFDLKFFKKNPVFLDSHNYDSITHILGRVENISTKSGSLEGDIDFALANPKGRLAAEMAGEYLFATSIGFIPKEFSDKGEILKSELLEISAVSVPANPHALLERAAEVVEQKAVEDEPAPVAVPSPVRVSPMSVAAKVAGGMVREQDSMRKTLAAVVAGMTEGNVQARKRKALSIIRNLSNDSRE